MILSIISFHSLLDTFLYRIPLQKQTGTSYHRHRKSTFYQACHVDVINLGNPINCSCDGPEGGHKKWVKQQGAKTNQGPSAALTMMQHSLNKEVSVLLCDAIQGRIQDGDAPQDQWFDSKGSALNSSKLLLH